MKKQHKFWFGYKKHVAVDTQSGMITKVTVTKANVTDVDGAKHVLPQFGAILADRVCWRHIGYTGTGDCIRWFTFCADRTYAVGVAYFERSKPQ